DTVQEIPLPFVCDPPAGHWAIVAQILFGVINDAGGLIWVPGRGPVPVDPWGPLSPAERDVLTALAIARLAAQIEDTAAASKVRTAAVDAVVHAAGQLRKQIATGPHM